MEAFDESYKIITGVEEEKLKKARVVSQTREKDLAWIRFWLNSYKISMDGVNSHQPSDVESEGEQPSTSQFWAR